MKNSNLQEKCLKYVSLSEKRPVISDIYRLLCSLEAGLTLKEVCFRNDPNAHHIDERKLIQFGLMHGLIRHLQKYPVLPETGTLPPSHTYLSPYLDGCKCYDEICCSLAISNQKLDDILDSCPDVIVCWK